MSFTEVIVDTNLSRAQITNIQGYSVNRIIYTTKKLKDKYTIFFESLQEVVQLTTDELEHIEKDVIDYWDSLPKVKFNNKSISELLPDINGTYSYWYGIRFPVYYYFKDHYKKYTLFEKIAHSCNGKAVLCITNSNFQFDFPSFSFQIGQKKPSKKKWQILFQYIFIGMLRALIGIVTGSIAFFRRSKFWLTNSTNVLQYVYDFQKHDLILGNNYQHYLLKNSLKEDDFSVLSEYSMPSLVNQESRKFNWKMIFSEGWVKSVNFETFFLPILLSLNYWKVQKRYKNSYIKEIRRVSELENGINAVFLNSVVSKVNLIKLSVFRDCISNLFLKIFKPQVIASVCEYNLNNYSLLKQYSLKKGKTLAIQHGAIFKENISYKYSSFESFEKAFLPDQTLLWGEKWKNNIVVGCNYPESKTKVLGQIRSEAITRLQSLKAKEKFFLYISQPLRAGEESKRDILLDNFLEACVHHREKQFVIKPHPRETDPEFFYSKIRAKGLNNVSVEYKDLFILLSESKAVIIYFSTVGIEALAFNKQLIVLDFYNEDSLDLIKEGVGIGVSNLEELKHSITEIAEGRNSISKEVIKDYVNSYFYRIESDVSQRYTDYIKCFRNEK